MNFVSKISVGNLHFCHVFHKMNGLIEIDNRRFQIAPHDDDDVFTSISVINSLALRILVETFGCTESTLPL